MTEDERIWGVVELLFGYVQRPSLRHIRDPHSVTKLSLKIVRQIDRGNSVEIDTSAEITALALPCKRQGDRLSLTKDKMWDLHRVALSSDDETSALIGKYQRHGGATKVVETMAYQPEPT